MASPLGHGLMGVAVGRLSGVKSAGPSWRWYASAMIGANVPDLDFFPGLLIGDINRFHIRLAIRCLLPLRSACWLGSRPASRLRIRCASGWSPGYCTHPTYCWITFLSTDVHRSVSPCSGRSYLRIL